MLGQTEKERRSEEENVADSYEKKKANLFIISVFSSDDSFETFDCTQFIDITRSGELAKHLGPTAYSY